MAPLRVLLVEDSPADAELVVDELRKSFDLEEATRVQDAGALREALAQGGWDLILSDWSMPQFNAPAALQIANDLAPDVPFIIISGTIGEQTAVDAMRAGARDFILKNSLARLVPAVHRELLAASSRAELRSRNREYERFFNLTQDLLCVLGFDGYMKRVNPAWERVLGWTAAEICATPALELLHPEDREGASLILEHMRNGGPLPPFEARHRCKDGGYRSLLWSVSVVPGEQLAYASGWDITERKQTELALRASMGHFRMLFESSPLPNWLLDVETLRFLEVNEAACRTYGYSRAEFLGMTIRDLRLPGDTPQLTEEASSKELGPGEYGVWTHRRKDGTRRDVELRGETFLLAGRVCRLVVAQDMTERLAQDARSKQLTADLRFELFERKRAERSLIARVRVAALAAEVGVALTGGESLPEVLQRCAAAMVQELGVASARIWTLAGEGEMLELQATAGLDGDPSQARVSLNDPGVGRIARQRAAYQSNDVKQDPVLGHWQWAQDNGIVAFAGHPLLVEGQLVGMLGVYSREPLGEVICAGLGPVAHSVAIGIRRKLAEAARRGLEAQLRQAQKMEAIGSLAGGIAHDFNNLLSVILSYSRLLIDDLPPGSPMRRELDEISAAGERASRLTGQLLAFSRQQVLQPRVVDLREIIAGMQEMLRRVIGEDIELVTVAAAEPARVHVDPGQIEQVIMNLVVNARDAMPSGGRLTVELARVALDAGFAAAHPGVVPGPHVLLSVSDTGVGMDAATQARAFEPFFTTKEQGKGTGLGLSMVFGIVRQSAGTVALQSEPGQGTVFRVYLPVANAVAAEDPALASSQLRTLRGTETLLLVEDDEQVRSLARTVLQRHGYQVVEARGGKEALAAARGLPRLDLLLTDVVMPRMSGAQVAERLLAARPGLKVLFMSGYTDDAVVFHGVLHANVAFLQKPLTPTMLLSRVREVLDARTAEPVTKEERVGDAPVVKKPAGSKPRVLVVDDEAVLQRLIARALPGCEVVGCSGAREALGLLESGEPFEVVLCDVHLPGMSGMELHEELAARGSKVADTMLFMTGGATSKEVEGFVGRLGPRVLQKPVEVKRLREVVDGLVAREQEGKQA